MEIRKQKFEEQLIELVRERPWLFDIGLADYKDKDKKINGWKFIGELLGKSGAECETEWSKIRKQFIDNVRKRKAATGSGRESFPKFRHFESMQFYLDRYRSYPRIISNMDDGTPWSPSSNDIDETDSSVPDNSPPRIVEVETPMPSSDTNSTMSNSQMSFLSSQASPSSSSNNISRASNTNYVQSKPPEVLVGNFVLTSKIKLSSFTANARTPLQIQFTQNSV